MNTEDQKRCAICGGMDCGSPSPRDGLLDLVMCKLVDPWLAALRGVADQVAWGLGWLPADAMKLLLSSPDCVRWWRTTSIVRMEHGKVRAQELVEEWCDKVAP